MSDAVYQIYIVECDDGSLYTGIARDVKKRMQTHQKKNAAGAKYTKSRTVSRVRALFSAADRSAALKLEYRIKKLTRKEKFELIRSPDVFFDFFPDLDSSLYAPDLTTDLSALIE